MLRKTNFFSHCSSRGLISLQGTKRGGNRWSNFSFLIVVIWVVIEWCLLYIYMYIERERNEKFSCLLLYVCRKILYTYSTTLTLYSWQATSSLNSSQHVFNSPLSLFLAVFFSTNNLHRLNFWVRISIFTLNSQQIHRILWSHKSLLNYSWRSLRLRMVEYSL